LIPNEGIQIKEREEGGKQTSRWLNNALTTERESHKKGKCAVLDERKVR